MLTTLSTTKLQKTTFDHEHLRVEYWQRQGKGILTTTGFRLIRYFPNLEKHPKKQHRVHGSQICEVLTEAGFEKAKQEMSERNFLEGFDYEIDYVLNHIHSHIPKEEVLE
jgi:hypothetical protein